MALVMILRFKTRSLSTKTAGLLSIKYQQDAHGQTLGGEIA